MRPRITLALYLRAVAQPGSSELRDWPSFEVESRVWGSCAAGVFKVGHWRGGGFVEGGLQKSWGRSLPVSTWPGPGLHMGKMRLSKDYQMPASMGLKAEQGY